ncbi:MAG: 50S ribosomal protein L30 [Bacteroidales bacterium]|nr:50S ribosomal protein L30 [Bacteroidales bacterium]
MAQIKITLTRSRNSADKRQRANLDALGLHRLHHSVVKEATPVINGMVQKVLHLVTVEEVK